jgi:succinoglycan biosynthesis protein ExoA
MPTQPPVPERPGLRTQPADTAPFVSIVVPTLNEERYIEDCLRSLAGCAAGVEYEILVMDGGSTDRTREIVGALARSLPGIVLHDNPGRLQSAAMNLAARLALPRAGVILRADAHALYPPGFVRRCLDALAEHDAASVVVPMLTVGTGGMQRAIAAAQNSRFGNGGSAHRTGGRSGFVEHGHHAAFDRATFLRLGGYDTRFTHNEDAEFDHRLRRGGGRIWMCGDAPVTYFPRETLRRLGQQYVRHGRGRARTLLLHRLRPKPRQLAPVCVLLLCASSLPLALANAWFLLVPAAYAALCLAWAARRSVRTGDPWLLAAAPAVMTMHLCWAWGFLGHLAAGRGHGKTA